MAVPTSGAQLRALNPNLQQARAELFASVLNAALEPAEILSARRVRSKRSRWTARPRAPRRPACAWRFSGRRASAPRPT